MTCLSIIIINNNYNVISFCLVANPPEDLTLTQHGPMNITVSWTPPTPLNHTSGYRVYYKPSDSTSWQNITINDASITTVNVTGLTSGIYYNVSIASLSEHFPSETIQRDIYLGQSCYYQCHMVSSYYSHCSATSPETSCQSK